MDKVIDFEWPTQEKWEEMYENGAKRIANLKVWRDNGHKISGLQVTLNNG